MIGKAISHYIIIEELGRGGMGEVYLAEDLKLERKVAIKFLPQHLTSDKENVERFEREAKAAASLNHPHIVTIYEIAEENDQIFIVMEYVEGNTLRVLLNSSSEFPIPNSTNIISQIAEGLSRAHKAGIVHRDIKPANIIITHQGEVKILDFGLAKLAGRIEITKDTSTLGTVAYMSPEQAKGEKVDHRTDIWSLGVIMYEMLCGERPFKGEYEQAVFYSIFNDNPTPVADHRPDLPPELTNIVDKAISKSAEDRYQSAEQIVNDLVQIDKSGKETKRPSGSSALRTKKVLPRKRFWRILVSSLAAVIVAGIIYILAVNPSQNKEPMGRRTKTTDGIVQNDIDNSIVVLPFKDISPAGDNQYFSDGLTEEIITDLSRIRSLRVISTTSAMTLKNTEMDIKTIGKKLDLRYVIEGSVRKAGNELKITARAYRCLRGCTHLG